MEAAKAKNVGLSDKEYLIRMVELRMQAKILRGQEDLQPERDEIRDIRGQK